MASISQGLASLRERLEAFSPRERAGVALVAAVVSVMLAGAAIDWSVNGRADAVEAAKRLSAAEAAFERESNRGYQEGVRAAASAAESSSIVEASSGIAHARAVVALRALVSEAGLTNAVISANQDAADETVDGAVSPLVMTVSADFNWQGFLALLRGLRTSDLAFSPQAIEVSSTENGGQTFVLTVQAPFIRQARQS